MANNTAEALNLRPKKDTKNMELFKAIHRAQHVQRNFDLNKKMPEQDISTIVTAATQCTSKQNVAHYKLHAITNREIIEEIYDCTTCTPEHPEEAQGQKYARNYYPNKGAVKKKGYGKGNYPENPQVLGNLVLVFERYEKFYFNPKKFTNKMGDAANPQTFVTQVEEVREFLEDASAWDAATAKQKDRTMLVAEVLDRMDVDYHDKDELDDYINEMRRTLAQDSFTALGIAAGTVNLTASQLGYGTGCSTCIMNRPKLKKLLGMKKDPLLIMGIGFKQEGKNRRVHHKDDGYTFGTIKKQPIEISYIN